MTNEEIYKQLMEDLFNKIKKEFKSDIDLMIFEILKLRKINEELQKDIEQLESELSDSNEQVDMLL